MKYLLTILTLVLLNICPLTAQNLWKLDKGHSQVKFTVSHMLVSEVMGGFKDFDVTFNEVTNDFTKSTVEATIKIASITTDNDYRDQDLRSDNFFDAVKYPEAVFKSISLEKTGDNTYKIAGTLTMHDSTKSVVLDARVNGQITDKKGNTHLGIKATTTIDRFAFGVKWDRMIDATNLVVGKNVDITLLLEFVKEPKKEGEPPAKK
jgi:polyisoprenoid-binding protein YceI